MNSTLSEILAADTNRPQCKTCWYLTKSHGADHDALLAALRNPAFYSSSFIASALTRVGYKISESSIRRHRRNCRDVERPAERP